MPRRKLEKSSQHRASDAQPPASTHAKLRPVLTQRRPTRSDPLRKRKPSSRKLRPLEQMPHPRNGASITTISRQLSKLTEAEKEAKRKAFLSQPATPPVRQLPKRRNTDPNGRNGEPLVSYCLEQFLQADTDPSKLSAEPGAQADRIARDNSNASMHSAKSCETILAVSYSDESLNYEATPRKA